MNSRKNSFSKLNEAIDGDVLYDEVSRMLYATDASLYQELPLAVARPKSKADCQIIIKFANKNDIPIIPRAAGTSLAGQVVGNALIVDVSRYMTHILSIDKTKKTARIEPGVIPHDLNQRLAGSEIYQILVRTKSSFDPKNIFNPGKIVSCKKVDDDLRTDYGPQEPGPHKGYFNWGPGGSLYGE